MVKTEQFSVGNHEYSVTQWNATKAMIMKLKLAKFVGGLLGSLVTYNDNIANTLLANLNNILKDVNPEEFIDFIKEVACSASRDGQRMVKAQFDSYFNGEIMDAYEVAFKVLEINYKDFLASVLSLQKGK